VYSNSPVAIRRVVDASQGKRPALSAAKDFKYMRTLYPLGDPAEDGFVFLSDPFIRYLTGPKLRIAEKRRIEAVTTLELTKNAALFHLWENPGAKAPTLEALLAAGLLDKPAIAVEPGDKLRWDPDAFEASTSRYGAVGRLTPIVELPLDQVTQMEKQDYEAFRANYESYWRQYFDPIGIRITARERMALAVTVLPLIDNSEYNRTQQDIGGRAVELEPVPRGPRVLGHFATHLNPDSEDFKQLQTFTINLLRNESRASVEWIGERAEFWVEDAPELAKFAEAEQEKERLVNLFKVPMVFGVEVKNPLGLAAFLVAFKALVDTSAPNMVTFEVTEKYKEHSFTRIRPGAQASSMDPEFAGLSITYGAVGNMLYLSTSHEALKRVVDAVTVAGPARAGAGADHLFGAAKTGHMALRLNLSESKTLAGLIGRELAKRAWAAEREHLRNLWWVAQTAGLGPGARVPAEKVLGYGVRSALGNQFAYDPLRDEVAGTVTGSLWATRRVTEPPAGSPLAALLRSVLSLRGTLEFTKDGLHTELSINRKP
jgi:hypothetical protein